MSACAGRGNVGHRLVLLLVLVWLSLRRRRRRCWEASPRRDHRPGGIAGGHVTPARAPSCYICGRRQLAAVRSSCAFRAALPASRTNRRCGRCVRWRMRTSREAAIARAGHLPFGRRDDQGESGARGVMVPRGRGGRASTNWRASMGSTERSPVNERAGWHDEWVE